jgi:hypothetical protein
LAVGSVDAGQRSPVRYVGVHHHGIPVMVAVDVVDAWLDGHDEVVQLGSIRS